MSPKVIAALNFIGFGANIVIAFAAHDGIALTLSFINLFFGISYINMLVVEKEESNNDR